MAEKYRVGGLDVALLSDGEFYYDAGAVFGIVPRILWEPYAGPLDADHRLTLSLNSLLLRSEGKLVLIETGIGDKRHAARQASARADGNLLTDLARIDVDPGEVDIVINTHLHADHCGWNTRYRDGVASPTFPNATYLVLKDEWQAATAPDERTRATYVADNLLPIESRLELVEGEKAVTDEISIVAAPGHSAGHAFVVIASGGERAIYIGDLAQMAAQLERTAWVSAFDILPLVSMATKRTLVEEAVETGSMLIGSHIPGAGRMVRGEDGRRRWVAVAGVQT